MSSYARTERAALCDLFEEIGPDQPTLCEGWLTRDLAAHLVLRERGWVGAAGIVIRPLAGHTERVQRELASRPWSELVALLRSGPPRTQLVGWFDESFNTIEFVVHHEDVRRAREGWTPRQLPTDQQDDLWRRLRQWARPAFRRARGGVVLERPGAEPVTVRTGEPVKTISGEPLEVLMYAYGRRDHAVVTVTKDAKV
jgi:uncharacterized protein (TIGR03085 family)